MDNETKVLVDRLRTHFDDCPPRSGEKSFTRPLIDEAARTIEAQSAEINRLTLNGIHTCSDRCMRPACVARRERDEARAMLAEAIERIAHLYDSSRVKMSFPGVYSFRSPSRGALENAEAFLNKYRDAGHGI